MLFTVLFIEKWNFNVKVKVLKLFALKNKDRNYGNWERA